MTSFLALSANGGDRISFTFDEIDGDAGEIITTNRKESFVVVNEDLREHVNAIRDYIRTNKLAD